MKHDDIKAGDVVLYTPGTGTYGYEDLLNAEGRIRVEVRGFGPPRKGNRADRGPLVLITFFRGNTAIKRGVDATSLQALR